jgi:hypothetical protein
MNDRGLGGAGAIGSVREGELGAGQAVGIIFLLLFVSVGIGAYILFSNQRSVADRITRAFQLVTLADLEILTLGADGVEVPVPGVAATIRDVASEVAQSARVAPAEICATLLDRNVPPLVTSVDGADQDCANQSGTVQTMAANTFGASINTVNFILALHTRDSAVGVNPLLLPVAAAAGAGTVSGAATPEFGPTAPTATPTNTPTATPYGPGPMPNPPPTPTPTPTPTPGAGSGGIIGDPDDQSKMSEKNLSDSNVEPLF